MTGVTAVKQAVILAGGRGIRLKPLTDGTPKPMVPVNNRPFLEYLIDLLKDNGISEVVLLLGYLPEKITGHFGNGKGFGIDIRYSIGDVDDETGTRLRNAAPLLDDVFLMLYGDNYWPLQLDKLAAFYEAHRTLASTTVYANTDGQGEYGPENNIYVDESDYVAKYDKSRRDSRLNGVDIGFFVLNKRILELMPEVNISFEETVLPRLVEKRQLCGYRTLHRYHYISNPDSLRTTEAYLRRTKVVLLDRDGVINRKAPEGDYIKSWSEFEFLPGAVEALRLLTVNGYDIHIITNQRGIARGLMSEAELEAIHREMRAELEKHGAKVGGIYVCPHGQDEGCGCRKPEPGLLFRAASDYDFNLTGAVFIGDSESDLQAGNAAGCRTVLVRPGYDLMQVVNGLLES